VFLAEVGVHTPTIFYAPGPFDQPPPSPIAPETFFGGCSITDNDLGDGIYYYDPATHMSLNGTYNQHPPATSGFLISQQFSGVKGLLLYGQTGNGSAIGSPPGSFALAAAYVTNHRCSDGNIEYGFYRDFTGNIPIGSGPGDPNAMVFYYSNFTNCDGAGECRNSPFGWNASSPIYQHNGPVVGGVFQPVSITNVGNVSPFGFFQYYAMYIIPDSASAVKSPITGFDFRIQILNAQFALATCQINGGPVGPCTTDIAIGNVIDPFGNQSAYPVMSMMSGQAYVLTGTQVSTGTNPNYQGYPAFWQNALYLGF
jgi:hypothetical protein